MPAAARILRLALAALILQGALVWPAVAAQGDWRAALVPQLEILLIAGMLLIPAGRWSTIIRDGVTGMLLLVLLLRLADIGTIAALGRPFDLYLDWHLVPKAAQLMVGSIGPLRLLLIGVGAGLGLALAGMMLHWATREIAKAAGRLESNRMKMAALLLAAGVLGTVVPVGGAAQSTAALSAHVAQAVHSARDLTAFRAEAAADPTDAIPANQRLALLKGKDVLVVFIESYGASALTDPAFKGPVGKALQELEETLAAKGFGARSAFLTSTTTGGQSWLAHASLLGGLRVDSQARYESFVGKPRRSLVSDFAQGGWETVAVAPAITQPWPEVQAYGFDRVLTAADLGYKGQPFNWVTMPDQFTLAAFERLVRAAPARPPVMAHIALISSHAPWTPLPELVPWDEIGDGQIFDAMATAGEPPDVLWRDPQRVRVQYGRSIEYTLATIAAYVRQFGDEDLVLIVLGDHPPVPWIAGSAAREVPVHILAGDPAISDTLDPWAWAHGVIPAPDAPFWPMASFRERLVKAFSAASTTAQVR
ncbi:sulfatase-like hydrolase/transferase [Rhodoligotrophos defluvii]|uniref:sulfatase-like hydrolase/transferase n=1 Tax=Rhodoligotrophos defluvii TaxID=2561934 RepID=UPI0010C94E97|nr:sulfatase-like hydrolase/transferase [Rhodoligotrophos defluvii]